MILFEIEMITCQQDQLKYRLVLVSHSGAREQSLLLMYQLLNDVVNQFACAKCLSMHEKCS